MRPMFNNQCMSSGMCPPQCPPTVMAPGPNSVPPNEFYPPPFSPYMRRPNPFHATADFRIYEFNRRLQLRPEVSFSFINFWINLLSSDGYMIDDLLLIHPSYKLDLSFVFVCRTVTIFFGTIWCPIFSKTMPP